MADVVFPTYVEAFIEETRRYLESFDAQLELVTENSANQTRLYQIPNNDEPVKLIVHRTERSMEHPVGEFRCRVHADLKPELAAFMRGKENIANRYATLGALITDGDRAYVLSQCLIQPAVITTVAGVLAAAIIHARPSILVSIRRAMNQEPAPTIERLSAWGDLDFEQLQYDYAHLGIGTHSKRSWTMNLLPHGAISLDAVHNNPYWGGGLLCLSWIPESVLRVGDSPVDVTAMNKWENLIADVPTFGGWCSDEDKIVFAQFLPNFLKGLPNFTDLLIFWTRRRLGSAKELVDVVQQFEKRSVAEN
jgi:hypothetical protein